MRESSAGAGVGAGEVLFRGAFGDGGAPGPLPEPAGPRQRWHRAVIYGGRGAYARARSDLDQLLRDPNAGLWRSFAASAQASLIRQLGGHRAAASLDGRALALATSAPADPRAGARAGEGSSDRSRSVCEARCDALTGLAADALGCARFDLARRLLDRVAAELDAAELDAAELDAAGSGVAGLAVARPGDVLWRPRLRLHWVSAETAMASGRASAALEYAQIGVGRAADCPSARHRIKSDLVLAAALCASGRHQESATLAEQVADECDRRGLLPLRWAAAMLLTAVRPEGGFDRVRDECAAAIARGGGSLT